MAGTIKHLQTRPSGSSPFKADEFVAADGGTGPFTTTGRRASTAETISRLPGRKAPTRSSTPANLKGKDVTIIGIVAGGWPHPWSTGSLPRVGQAVTD
jgi:hypothetical protein